MAQLDLSGDTGSNIDKPLVVTGDITTTGALNITGNITTTGDLIAAGGLTLGGTFTASDFTFTSGPFIGELFIQDTTLTDGTATATSAYTKLTQWQSEGAESNMTVTTSGGEFTIVSSGWYELMCALSITTTINGTYGLQVHSDTGAIGKMKHSINLANTDRTVFITGLLSLASSQTVDLRAISTTGAGSIIIQNGNFSLQKVG